MNKMNQVKMRGCKSLIGAGSSVQEHESDGTVGLVKRDTR